MNEPDADQQGTESVPCDLYQIQEKVREAMRYNHGWWSLGTSGVEYLDAVAVYHDGQIIDTWQKAKKWFSKWHTGDFVLIWEDGKSFRVYHISIRRK